MEVSIYALHVDVFVWGSKYLKNIAHLDFCETSISNASINY